MDNAHSAHLCASMSDTEKNALVDLVNTAEIAYRHSWLPDHAATPEFVAQKESEVVAYVDALMVAKDAELAQLKERVRILKDKLETAEDTIKRLRSNQIPEMGDLSHNARAAFYKSVLPVPLIEAWKIADKTLNEGGDYKKAIARVYEGLDDILTEFDLF